MRLWLQWHLHLDGHPIVTLADVRPSPRGHTLVKRGWINVVGIVKARLLLVAATVAIDIRIPRSRAGRAGTPNAPPHQS